MKIVYIAGYGRSGSTLIEKVLSDNKHFLGLGEPSNMASLNLNASSKCTCGEFLSSCSVWGEVFNHFSDDELFEYDRLRKKFEGWQWIPCHQQIKGKVFERYWFLFNKFLKTLNDLYPRFPEKDYLIDSSKSARNSGLRPMMYARSSAVEVSMIHVVRDVRGCMWSNLKGSNRKLEKGGNPKIPFAGLRTALNWNMANHYAEKFQKKCSERYLLVKYEDFVAHPQAELNRIASFLNVNLSEQIAKVANGNALNPSHQIAGNRMRASNKIQLKLDEEWKKKLPFYYNALARSFAGAKLSRYGYLDD